MANWSNLPRDLLILIAKRIHFCEDYISFAEVCTSWQSAATKHYYTNKFPQIPWLMLGQGEEEEEENDTRNFFSLKKGIICKVMLPEASNTCCFSSQGWLLTSENNNKLYLLHPLSRIQIHLPSLKAPHDLYYYYYAIYNLHHITKVVLSSSPCMTSDYLVMLTWGCLKKLAFCRPGDAHWTITDKWVAQISDITYYDGRLYGVDSSGNVFVCDVNGCDPTMVSLVVIMPHEFLRPMSRWYILESQGKLLIVLRERGIFQVYELNLIEGKCFEVKNLGNIAIFLGCNSSLSVEACIANGCKANCIYFTNDFFDVAAASRKNNCESPNMGVYNLVDASTETYFEGKSSKTTTTLMWVEPSF